MEKSKPVQIGISGHIKNYDVFITVYDLIQVCDDKGELITKEEVKGIFDFADNSEALRLGWADFPDFEVIYVYDKDDQNFGYAVNLSDEWLSEWGYAPF